jgi:hypothetical protein
MKQELCQEYRRAADCDMIIGSQKLTASSAIGGARRTKKKAPIFQRSHEISEAVASRPDSEGGEMLQSFSPSFHKFRERLLESEPLREDVVHHRCHLEADHPLSKTAMLRL